MSSLRSWLRVQDGSRFELGVTSEDDAYVASSRLVDDRGREDTWSDSDLVPGPKRKTIRSPRNYAIRVRIGFTGERATVTVRARVLKPDGAVHGSRFVSEFSGRGGEIRRATLTITTSGDPG